MDHSVSGHRPSHQAAQPPQAQWPSLAIYDEIFAPIDLNEAHKDDFSPTRVIEETLNPHQDHGHHPSHKEALVKDGGLKIAIGMGTFALCQGVLIPVATAINPALGAVVAAVANIGKVAGMIATLWGGLNVARGFLATDGHH